MVPNFCTEAWGLYRLLDKHQREAVTFMVDWWYIYKSKDVIFLYRQFDFENWNVSQSWSRQLCDWEGHRVMGKQISILDWMAGLATSTLEIVEIRWQLYMATLHHRSEVVNETSQLTLTTYCCIDITVWFINNRNDWFYLAIIELESYSRRWKWLELTVWWCLNNNN